MEENNNIEKPIRKTRKKRYRSFIGGFFIFAALSFTAYNSTDTNFKTNETNNTLKEMAFHQSTTHTRNEFHIDKKQAYIDFMETVDELSLVIDKPSVEKPSLTELMDDSVVCKKLVSVITNLSVKLGSLSYFVPWEILKKIKQSIEFLYSQINQTYQKFFLAQEKLLVAVTELKDHVD